MTPSPDLITAALALPPDVRRRLAECPGPGWHCYADPDGPSAAPQHSHGAGVVTPDSAWLPADPSAIVEAAASRYADRVYGGLRWTHRGWWAWLDLPGDEAMSSGPDAHPSPIAAAVALLARVRETP